MCPISFVKDVLVSCVQIFASCARVVFASKIRHIPISHGIRHASSPHPQMKLTIPLLTSSLHLTFRMPTDQTRPRCPLHTSRTSHFLLNSPQRRAQVPFPTIRQSRCKRSQNEDRLPLPPLYLPTKVSWSCTSVATRLPYY